MHICKIHEYIILYLEVHSGKIIISSITYKQLDRIIGRLYTACQSPTWLDPQGPEEFWIGLDKGI